MDNAKVQLVWDMCRCTQIFSTKKVLYIRHMHLFQPRKFYVLHEILWSGMSELGTRQKIHPGARYLPRRTLISSTSGLLQKHIRCLLL